MLRLFILLLLAFSLPALAQEVADSSTIRLEKYKKQYEEGIITRQQYEVMVKKEEYTQKFEKDSTGYKRRHIPQDSKFAVYAGGSMLFITGTSNNMIIPGGMVGVAYKYHIKSAMIQVELDLHAHTNRNIDTTTPSTFMSLTVPIMAGYNGTRASIVGGGIFFIDLARFPNPDAGRLAKDGGVTVGFGYAFPLPKENAIDVQVRYARLFKYSLNMAQLTLGYNF